MAIALDYRPADLIKELRRAAAETDDPRAIIARMREPALRLAAAKGWLKPEYFDCDPAQGFGLHLLHEEPDHSLAVLVASWLPGRGVEPHNHGTWALVCGIEGRETNISWRRRDDGSRPGYAKIEESGRTTLGAGDSVHLLPDEIHSVRNDTDKVTVSLHLYGRHINHTQRSKFDPAAEREEPLVVSVR